ncbi:Uncharacterized protein PBTT_06944 [Plasmodiophora brassicae]
MTTTTTTVIMAVLAGAALAAAECSLPDAYAMSRASVQRDVDSTKVVVGMVTGPETPSDGSVVQFSVLLAAENSGAMMNVRESACCLDEQGTCQVWTAHNDEVVCHGIRVGVDYRVIVIARAQSPDSSGHVADVLVPVVSRSGHVNGVEADDVVMNETSWTTFRANALSTLLHHESQRITSSPGVIVAAPGLDDDADEGSWSDADGPGIQEMDEVPEFDQSLPELMSISQNATEAMRLPHWTVIAGIAGGVVLLVAVLAVIIKRFCMRDGRPGAPLIPSRRPSEYTYLPL